jgi:hypothetical protein
VADECRFPRPEKACDDGCRDALCHKVSHENGETWRRALYDQTPVRIGRRL